MLLKDMKFVVIYTAAVENQIKEGLEKWVEEPIARGGPTSFQKTFLLPVNKLSHFHSPTVSFVKFVRFFLNSLIGTNKKSLLSFLSSSSETGVRTQNRT